MKLRVTTLMYTLVGTLIATPIQAATVKFESDARVKRESDSFEVIKGGTELEIKAGTPILALTKAGVPVLVYQPASNSSKISITDADLQAVAAAELQPRLEANTSEIVNALRKSETMIQKKDYEQALQLLSDLEKKYPQISALLFLKGTTHFLLNQKTAAVESLEKGLALDPQNAPALKLLAQLKGTR